MRVKFALHLLLVLAVGVGGGLSHAAEGPIVIALDASLTADQRSTAQAALNDLAEALPPEQSLGVVVFGDVVLSTVAIAALDASQLEAIERALDVQGEGTPPNLVIGLERALDEIGDSDGGQLFLIANAAIRAAETQDDARFKQWYEELLLPAASDNNVAITLVSPADSADAAVIAVLANYPNNALLPFPDGDAEGTAQALTRSLMGRVLSGSDTTSLTTASLDAADTPPTATRPISENTPDILPAGSESSLATDAASVQVDSTPAVATGDLNGEAGSPRDTNTPALTVADNMTADTDSISDANAIPLSSAENAESEDASLKNGSSGIPPFAIGAFVVGGLCLALFAALNRKRRSPEPVEADSNTIDPTGTSSAYLPLNATRARANAPTQKRDPVGEAPTAQSRPSEGARTYAIANEAATARRSSSKGGASADDETVLAPASSTADTSVTSAQSPVIESSKDAGDVAHAGDVGHVAYVGDTKDAATAQSRKHSDETERKPGDATDATADAPTAQSRKPGAATAATAEAPTAQSSKPGVGTDASADAPTAQSNKPSSVSPAVSPDAETGVSAAKADATEGEAETARSSKPVNPEDAETARTERATPEALDDLELLAALTAKRRAQDKLD